MREGGREGGRERLIVQLLKFPEKLGKVTGKSEFLGITTGALLASPQLASILTEAVTSCC